MRARGQGHFEARVRRKSSEGTLTPTKEKEGLRAGLRVESRLNTNVTAPWYNSVNSELSTVISTHLW